MNIYFNDILPNYLSSEELIKLLALAREGNMAARNRIIEFNLRLVLYEVYTKFSNFKHLEEDLISVGTIGLIKAVDTFNMDKNNIFYVYAVKCIENEIKMFLRKNKWVLKEISFEDYLIIDQDDFKIEDLIMDECNLEEEYLNKETKKILRDIIDELPERDKTIILMYYGFNSDKLYTHEEIGQVLSISTPHVSTLKLKVLKKIKDELIKRDLFEVNTSPVKRLITRHKNNRV